MLLRNLGLTLALLQWILVLVCSQIKRPERQAYLTNAEVKYSRGSTSGPAYTPPWRDTQTDGELCHFSFVDYGTVSFCMQKEAVPCLLILFGNWSRKDDAIWIFRVLSSYCLTDWTPWTCRDPAMVRSAVAQRVFPLTVITMFSLLSSLNPLNAELNPICYLLALLAHHFSPR